MVAILQMQSTQVNVPSHQQPTLHSQPKIFVESDSDRHWLNKGGNRVNETNTKYFFTMKCLLHFEFTMSKTAFIATITGALFGKLA
jgi:hypothetical protein